MVATTTTTTTTARSGGLLHALYTLVKPATFEARVPARAGLSYATDRPLARGAVRPLCDVYLPDAHVDVRALHPSVIVVHGGGFVIGSRGMKPVRLVASRLCERGIAVCAVDYRLLFRGGGLAAQIADIDAAAAFWRAQAETFGCDPARISMLGFSAGATLAMLHAGRSTQVYHRLVSVYGATEFDRVTGRRATLLLRLVLGTDDRRAWREHSPATHMARPNMTTPLLLIHGTADDMVPVEHSMRLHERRLAEGLPTEIELIEGMRHGFVNDASLPETTRALERAVAFIRD